MKINRNDLISELSFRKTWVLIILSYLTLGIYVAHYIGRQTRIINSYLEQGNKISNIFVFFVFILSYSSIVLALSMFFVETTEIIDQIISKVSLVWMVAVIYWAIWIREKIHTILNAEKDNSYWFNGFLCVVFQIWYFNFINFKIEHSLTLVQKE